MFVKFPLADTVEEAPRLATRSLRKVSRPEPAPDVPVVLLDELLPEASWIADTRLLKSDFSVLRLLFTEEVEELPELFSNSEIRFSSLLEKLE